MLKKLLLILCLSFLSSCSRNTQLVNLSQKFFNACDHKDFKLAYTFLSEADKRAMTADSFYVMFYNMDDQIARLDSSSAVSTFIDRTAGDTAWVTQVWRVPDYALINKTKPEDVKFSTFFAKMDSEKAVPMKLDSSRAVCLVKDRGDYYIYLGLDKFSKFVDSYQAMMRSYSSQVSVVPKSIEVYSIGYGSYSAQAAVEVDNKSSFAVSGFVCSISIDNTVYDSDCNAFVVTAVPPRKSVVSSEYLSKTPILLTKYLGGLPFGRIKGGRITITPTSVYFDTSAYGFMRNVSMKKSGFEEFTFLAPGYSKVLLDF